MHLIPKAMGMCGPLWLGTLGVQMEVSGPEFEAASYFGALWPTIFSYLAFQVSLSMITNIMSRYI